MKICTKCKLEKKESEFYFKKRYRDNLSSVCKVCSREYQKKYCEVDEHKIAFKEYRSSINHRAYEREYRQSNEYKMYLKKYRQSDGYKKYQEKYRKKRRLVDFRFRLRLNVSSLVSAYLRRRLSGKGGRSTFDFLPYTIDDLIQHLEGLFTEGMTWQNYGKWQIDHVKPDSLFDYKNVYDNEFQKCWALTNLQPLWAIENQIKGNRIL